MFYFTLAILGLLLANNLHTAPRLYSTDNPATVLAGDQGYKHAHYHLHRRYYKDLALQQPRYWNKSKTYADIVNQANGPSEKRTPFNLAVSKQGHIGAFPPVVAQKGKHL